MTCPRCGRRIEQHSGFTTWCPACEWGLPDPPSQGRVARLRESLSQRAVDGLYANVLEHGHARGGLLLRVGAYALAAAVHLFTLGLVFLGLAIFHALPTLAGAVVALLPNGLAAGVAPRPWLGRKLVVVPLRDMPELDRLFSAVAGAVGGPRPDRLTLTAEVNAWVGRRYWFGPRVLALGVPLWSLAQRQERVALLAHEFGHWANGDLRRSQIVATALQTLGRWDYVLRSSPDLGEHTIPIVGEMNPSAMSRLLQPVISAVLWLVGLIPRTLGFVLLWLTQRQSQRAEFDADRVAARVAGRSASSVILGLVAMQGSFALGLRRAAMNHAADPLADAVGYVRDVPASERERQLRLDERRRTAFDSHPPTAQRVGFVVSLPEETPSLLLDPEWSRRIDQELASFASPLVREAIDTAVHRAD
jgi:Zn-dependent protease with chaperone function